MTETCPCGATFTGDKISVVGFHIAHRACREAWAEALRATEGADIGRDGSDV